jgi:uncharacterized YccA/Bax inhibitor family protein
MAQQMINEQTFSPTAIQAAGGVKTGGDRMSIAGVTIKSLILLIITGFFGAIGWRNAERVFETANGMWFLLGFMILIALSLAAASHPQIAFALGLVYAVFMGLYMGSISKLYNELWDGIVPQALMATVCVFAVCLVLYNIGAVKVTAKFTRVVIAATLGIALLYLVAWILSIFDVDIYFWTNPNALGIVVSAGIALVAALNLFIDFDMIDKGVNAGAPKSMEWYSAFGLLATLVWLYLQVLQLLALTRSR